MTTRDRLFAYGTILDNPQDPQVQAAITRYTDKIDDAYVPGRLYDLGSFPGAVPLLGGKEQQQHWVKGQILEIIDSHRVFKVLDAYEDADINHPKAGMFRREKVTVTPNSASEEPFTCYIYWINKVPPYAHRIEDGDWLSHTKRKAGIKK
ncbi:gamma-glutamylcyclotransferase family protein [Halorhodospira halochloris]|uniref:gamma-glutamylcyclotransferase family protein n=1 Tax=Halorhodospira halochloris TaxID=1052 RepID=UPI001EE7D93A|nr:gamma-glutamylcyclotransferase family protein [Halorhodospira halochloris]MCG5547398.1 gamma-glutamylcyclotransferase [Halorhodospira halochloris]